MLETSHCQNSDCGSFRYGRTVSEYCSSHFGIDIRRMSLLLQIWLLLWRCQALYYKILKLVNHEVVDHPNTNFLWNHNHWHSVVLIILVSHVYWCIVDRCTQSFRVTVPFKHCPRINWSEPARLRSWRLEGPSRPKTTFVTEFQPLYKFCHSYNWNRAECSKKALNIGIWDGIHLTS